MLFILLCFPAVSVVASLTLSYYWNPTNASGGSEVTLANMCEQGSDDPADMAIHSTIQREILGHRFLFGNPLCQILFVNTHLNTCISELSLMPLGVVYQTNITHGIIQWIVNFPLQKKCPPEVCANIVTAIGVGCMSSGSSMIAYQSRGTVNINIGLNALYNT